MEKITKDMIMGDIVRNYEGAISVLMGIGMGCISCPAALNETLSDAAMVHGLKAEDVVATLNEQFGLM